MASGKRPCPGWRWTTSLLLALGCLCATGAQSIPGGGGANPLDPMQGAGGTSAEESSGSSKAAGERLGAVPRGGDLQNSQQTERYDSKSTQQDREAAKKLDKLPPDKPTEFQQMVLNSTGQKLPIYGASLFHNAPTTFAPLDRVPVTADYAIGPGDELLVQLWGQVSLNSRMTVNRAGNIYIPQVGTVRVAGLPFAKLQSYLQSEVGKVFRNFDLNVNMGQQRSIQILVVGQARRPGSYTASSLSTMVDAVFETGGPMPQESLRPIQLQRAGGQAGCGVRSVRLSTTLNEPASVPAKSHADGERGAGRQDEAASSSAAALVEEKSNRFETRNAIVLSEPDIDWNYAVIERQDKQTLTTSLVPFNLGRIVLDGIHAQDVALEPGDVITIFSKADIRVPQAQQTRLVVEAQEVVRVQT